MISRCWAQDPKERPKMEEIASILKEMNTIVKKLTLNEDGTVNYEASKQNGEDKEDENEKEESEYEYEDDDEYEETEETEEE